MACLSRISVFHPQKTTFCSKNHIAKINISRVIMFCFPKLDWFRSFLSNISQIVGTNQQRSCSLDVNIGVPQGYPLDSLLFIMYINDLNKPLTMLKSIHFADNTTLYLDINPSNNRTYIYYKF